MGPTRENLVLDPLAVQHLNNWLFIWCFTDITWPNHFFPSYSFLFGWSFSFWYIRSSENVPAGLIYFERLGQKPNSKWTYGITALHAGARASFLRGSCFEHWIESAENIEMRALKYSSRWPKTGVPKIRKRYFNRFIPKIKFQSHNFNCFFIIT